MSENLLTDANFIRFQNARDPLQLLVESLQDLILTALADASAVSPQDLPLLYLAKSHCVSGEKLGDRYSMRFDLHIKGQEQAKDVTRLNLEFVVKPQKVTESC